MRGASSPLIWLIARLFVGGVIAFAGFMKLMEPRQIFQLALEGYGVFPPHLIPIVARALPWVEWLGGMSLVFGYAPRLSATVLAGLTLGFLSALAAGPLAYGAADWSCGCFGEGFQLTQRQVFFLDLMNLFLLGMLIWKGNFPFSLDRWLTRRRPR
jgi:uncharacterized membrane protein YphA (DoxX/SURF4 family)